MTNEEFTNLSVYPNALTSIKVRLQPKYEIYYEGIIVSYDNLKEIIGFKKTFTSKSDDYDRVVRYFNLKDIESITIL